MSKLLARIKLSSEFLKNSTSSNKFKIKPKQKATRRVFNKNFRKIYN